MARTLTVTTPLGPDALILVGFTGQEALSQPFSFQLDVVAESRKEVPFDKLLGQPVLISLLLAGDKNRYFSGICNRVRQGQSDGNFTSYRLEVVPQIWLLTRCAQSRIFQHQSVPDILKKVLQGLDVSFEIQGTFHPRDFCVQYRETDFNFVSRLMEEEGIYYFFKHSADGHKMVVANTPASHPPLPVDPKVLYEAMTAGRYQEDRIFTWEKGQELRSGKYTLWDHCFELPHKHLETEQLVQDSVTVGSVTHKLKVGNNDKLEIYDYPGEYAQRFDGIDKGGGEQPAELEKIFQDNKRTVALRMQQETVPALVIDGASSSRRLVSGHKFTLERHFNGDGDYVITSVQHAARTMDVRSGSDEGFQYSNRFTCIPAELPFRPLRVTPKPIVQGTQTAVVVGPKGEEIFCDKYGRVKVQFHWDREGKYDADSSCWVRVSTIWAGKTWGITNVPRIGHEVIIDFLEGDPDQPIIIGSVHNADHVPTGELPKGKMISGLKSNSTPGGGGYNGLVFNDTKGKEKIELHGQYDMSTVIEHDDTQHIINNRKINVDGTHTETIKKDTKITISEGTFTHDVVAKTATYHVKGAVKEDFDATQTTTVKQKIMIQSADADIEVNGKTQIKLISGDSSIVLKADGTIEISGKNITISGTAETKMGVGNQNVKCDTALVALAGAGINSGATGKHEISGAVVKIN